MGSIYAADVGGNDIKYGAIDGDARIARTSTDPRNVKKIKSRTTEGPNATISQIEEAFKRLSPGGSARGLEAIGLAVAGSASLDGVIGLNVNFGSQWTKCPFREMVQQRFQVPTFYENDGNAAAIAEMRGLVQARTLI